MEKWIKTSVWLAVLLAIVTVQTSSPSAKSSLGAFADTLCTGVDCGNGTCVTSSDYPYVKCDCNPGWRQPSASVYVPFLACVIPNCSLDYTCNNSVGEAPSPSSDESGDHSYRARPCLYDVCGGGTCISKSDHGYICQCSSGYGNIMNWNNGYCVKKCAIQGECSSQGVTVSSSNDSTTSSSKNDGRGGLEFVKDNRDWMIWSMLATLFMILID